ncbi:outer membrane protein transport protein, partial [Escherichia coli]
YAYLWETTAGVNQEGSALQPAYSAKYDNSAHGLDRNVRIPVGDRKVFTVDAGWSPNQDLTVDVAYAYLWETTAGVNQEGSALQPAYSAKYDNSAHGL